MTERVPDASAHISERMWQDKVEQVAIINGWIVDHKIPMRFNGRPFTTGKAGMPDLILIHPRGHGILYVELKTERGKLSPAQIEVAAALRANGAEYYLWRPSQMHEVEERLGRWRKQ